MTAAERRAAFSLAGIFSFRMLGLFMIMPVFALYAETLEARPDPLLIGLAIGIYGLTQALLQIPFGMLSDRIGRKPVITGGLLLFAAGSVMAAMADSLGGVIAGRALQGSGAIAAAGMALTADLTREEHRARAMAVIGMSIGLSFALALALGPILDAWIGVPGIFWLTAVLALGGIVLLHYGVPRVVHSHFHRDAEPVPAYFSAVLRNRDLLRLDLGIFTLHLMLTASFVALPFALRDEAGIAASHHGYVYLPVLLLSLALMVPLVVIAEKRRRIKQVFLLAVLLTAAAELGLALFHHSLVMVVLCLLLFFMAFNVLEALLPSLIAKFAPADKKGTAMGVYSTSQFLGAFAGGVLGGALYGRFGVSGVFGACALLALWWWWLSRGMSEPRYVSSRMLRVAGLDEDQAVLLERQVRELPGVVEAACVVEEGVLYLKVDSQVVDMGAVEALVSRPAAQEGAGKGAAADAPAPAGN
ncbi:MAG TPA: MFS transporter [Gammaproteobacteria bacterium]|nr:MFS transporter [Gammaproteobacteria bacterium]